MYEKLNVNAVKFNLTPQVMVVDTELFTDLNNKKLVEAIDFRITNELPTIFVIRKSAFVPNGFFERVTPENIFWFVSPDDVMSEELVKPVSDRIAFYVNQYK